MKIYRNNVCVTMNLDEFHDILESDMFDELLLMIMELDENDAIETVYGDDYELSANHQVYHVEDMDSFMELLQDALDDDNVKYFMEESVGPEEGAAWWGMTEHVEESFIKPDGRKKKTNKADAKVKRILDRYKDVTQ